MKINFLPFLLLASFVFAQEDPEQLVEPIITDLDRLVESVKQTASSRSAEDNASCLLYTSPSPRDRTRSRMPSSA